MLKNQLHLPKKYIKYNYKNFRLQGFYYVESSSVRGECTWDNPDFMIVFLKYYRGPTICNCIIGEDAIYEWNADIVVNYFENTTMPLKSKIYHSFTVYT